MRRLVPLLAALLMLVPAGAAGAKPKPATWASTDIRLVTEHGLMGGDATRFRPDDAITRGELASTVGSSTASGAPGTSSRFRP